PVIYDPSATLSVITLPGGWEWTDGSVRPTVNNSGYYATYTPSDDGYEPVTVLLELTVTPILLEKPIAPQTSFGYTGSTITLSLKGFDGETMNVSGNTGIIVGDYVAYVTLTDEKNYAWTDKGPTGIDWTISSSPGTSDPDYVIPLPDPVVFDLSATLSDIVLPYRWTWDDGAAIPTVDNDGYYATYTSADSGFEPVTMLLELTVTPMLLEKPVATQTSFPYTGNAIALAIVGFDTDTMTISGNEQTSVGTYVAEITLKDDTNYAWIDGGEATIKWTITASSGTDDPDYILPILGSTAYGPSVTLSMISLPDGWAWDDGAMIPTVGNDGYYATYTPSDSGFEPVTMLIGLTVTPMSVDRPVAPQTSFPYTGNVITLALNGFDGETMDVSGNTGTTIGSYEAQITLKDDANYKWDPAGRDGDELIIIWTIIGEVSEFTLSPGMFHGGAILWSVGGGAEKELTEDESFPSGTVVTLTAAADHGYVFIQWSNGVSGTSSVTTIEVSSDITVSAEFSEVPTLLNEGPKNAELAMLISLAALFLITLLALIFMRSDDDDQEGR
ncbi:MAG: hypothetical protein FWD81_05340, partial [Methanomassiliicoccaceae archaeon]|nr:hypothetical protein [Methanomassiliicoccaceae archaeon]